MTMTVEELTAKLTAQEAQFNTLKGQLDTLTKRAERAEGVVKLSVEERKVFDGLSEDKQGEFLKADAESRKTIIAAVEKAEQDKQKQASEVPEPVRKQMEDLKKSVDDANARAAAAEVIAKREFDARQLAEFTKRAETEFGSLPGEPAEKGQILKVIHEKLDKEEAEKVSALLKAGSEALTQLGKTAGTDAIDPTTSAWGKIETLAKKYVADHKEVTFAKAVERVCEEDPKLYDRYLKEKPQVPAQ